MLNLQRDCESVTVEPYLSADDVGAASLVKSAEKSLRPISRFGKDKEREGEEGGPDSVMSP